MKISTLSCSIFTVLTLLTIPVKAGLYNPAQNWQTFETAHFKVHFPIEYKEWALSSARELENIRRLIKQQQHRILAEKVDAYVIDPYNDSNGFALPLSNKPYLGLFTTPPLSDSIIANTPSWQQLLLLHEYVHLIHLGQKNRSKWRNQLAHWFDIYDASQIKTERWVNEGYATLLESKLTGRGRLYNGYIEALLQQFAREGALPTYQQINGDNEHYLSGAMAYLIGSRFLKWLEDNYSEKTLDAVWTRLKAIKDRDFDQAFTGVFKDSAEHLYQRFIAEYTYKAIKNETSFSTKQSKLYLDLKDKVTALSLSPNSKSFALVETDKKGKVKLNIYSTAENKKAKKDFQEKMAQLLEQDPQDIIDKAPTVFKHKKLQSLNQINYRGITNPRWLNNKTIIYGAASLDHQGDRHQDLFSWNMATNEMKQLTTGENLRRFDISPNKDYIIAERSRYGYSQLVKVSITGNILTELTPASLEHIYDFPRFRPKTAVNDDSFAYLVSSLNEKWLLKVNTKGVDFIVPLPANYQFVSYPEWSQDGRSLFYVASVKNQSKIYQYNFKQKKLTALTSGQHPVSWPIAKNNEQLLLLETNSQGSDVYQLNITQDNNIEKVFKTTQSGKVALHFPTKFKLENATVKTNENIGTLKPYGIGSQQGTFTIGESDNSASNGVFELGYKSDDVLSRFAWQVSATKDIFNNDLSGVSANIRWQGWPIKILAHGYQLALKNKKYQYSSNIKDKTKEQGLFVEASYPYQIKTFKFTSLAQAKVTDKNADNSQYASLGFKQNWYHEQQQWGIKQAINLSYLTGKSDHKNYSGTNLQATISAHIKDYGLGFNYQNITRSNNANNILSLGGYASTLIQPKAHLNTILAPELAFNYATANQYQKYETFIPFSLGEVFYTKHDLQNTPNIYSYGVKGDLDLADILPSSFTGLSNLSISYGIAEVKQKNQKTKLQAWLSLWHKW